VDHNYAVFEALHDRYNRLDFIELDPISVPHQFTDRMDIEIAAFFAAIFAWGNRKSIIQKSNLFLSYMDHDPYRFICSHSENDLKIFEQFVHRTFNTTDALFFIDFLTSWYRQGKTLEDAFASIEIPKVDLINQQVTGTIEANLVAFHQRVINHEPHSRRSLKHVSTPLKNSTCKRLCMFLRWMVRADERKVDFGIWKSIQANQLICPIDVHVARVSRELNLIALPKINWKAALELTAKLRLYNAEDPVRYDFALFGYGVESHQTKFKG